MAQTILIALPLCTFICVVFVFELCYLAGSFVRNAPFLLRLLHH
jgi:hypothetical protein